MSYAELQVTTHFSFLRGASSPEELFHTAAALGLPALGICDRHSLAGIVRAHEAAKETGVRLVVGCRLDLTCGMSLLAYPTDRAAYARLTRLLSLGKARAGKGRCRLDWDDVAAQAQGLLAVLVPDAADAALSAQLTRLKATFADRAYLALSLRRRPRDALRLHRLDEAARRAGVPTVVTNDVLYHTPSHHILQDVVTCIREGCTIDDAGFRRERFAERYLKPPEEMQRLFARYEHAVARSQEIAARCRFSLDELKYQYPEEACLPGRTPQQALEKLTWAGAAERYPTGIPADVDRQLRHELQLIGELNYAPYFLTVNSIVRFARSQGILCQGRGSAANSAVCYVLGITPIDPVRMDLLFERFVSAERGEPPDIDVDFEHERREEVIQWIYATYGRERAALCATVIRYRSRGAIRDVGKALGLPEDVTGALAKQVWGFSTEGVSEQHAAELGLNLEDRRLKLTLLLAKQLVGTPRHLSQHPGGFVLTNDRLDELVPIEPARMADRQVIEWDKDDIDALGFMKVDVLGLGMLGCMRRAFDLLAEHKNQQLDLAAIPPEDPATYRMIRRADTVGVFQIESRAQMNMLPRLKPRTFYDLVVEVAVVRPGPIQGDMVHPYLRRRQGLEPVSYPTPELERVLGRTLGVPLFQEQAMKVAIVCAGFTPGEADKLRKAMATFKHTGGVSAYREKLIIGMIARGYDAEFAERIIRQIESFGSYGFPESHAASFALIAYASSWMKCHHPDAFCAALLNAQPMGFYAPDQIVRDAREHGVEVLGVDVNHSRWDCTLEPSSRSRGGLAVRLGLRLVKGLSNADAAALVAVRGDQRFASLIDVHVRAGFGRKGLERLAHADAFQSLGLDPREALWRLKGLGEAPLPLFAAADRHVGVSRDEATEPEVALVPMTAGTRVVEDYRATGLSLKGHPLTFLRDDLARHGWAPLAVLDRTRDGRGVQVAGLVKVRQKPGSAKGVMFITLEDETGIANLIVWPQLFEANRGVILNAALLGVRGRVQREGEVVHLIALTVTDLSDTLHLVGDLDLPQSQGGEVRCGGEPDLRTPVDGSPRDIYVPGLRLSSAIKVPTRDFR